MMHMELLLTIMSRPHVYQGRCQLQVPGTMRAAGSGPPHNGNRGATCKMQKIQGLRFASARARYQSGRRCNDARESVANKVRSQIMFIMELLHETESLRSWCCCWWGQWIVGIAAPVRTVGRSEFTVCTAPHGGPRRAITASNTTP